MRHCFDLLFLVLLVPCPADEFYGKVEYRLEGGRRSVCRSEETATSLRNRLLDVFSELECVSKERCRVELSGPPCINSPTRQTTSSKAGQEEGGLEMRILIIPLQSKATMDIEKAEKALKSKLSPILSPYLLRDNNPCGSDRVLDGNVCRVCLPGTYMSLRTCEVCPVGTYSSTPGVKECTRCPAGQTTTSPATSSSLECKDKCQGLVSPEQNLMSPAQTGLVIGSTLSLTCSGYWAFDTRGTKARTAKCGDALPACSVRWCPDPCLSGYTCDSCQCVNTTTKLVRCDGVKHCEDGSDETACPLNVEEPSSVQLSPHRLSYISVPRTWAWTSDIAVCSWARLRLSSSFSSLVSFEQEETHSLWIKLTRDALYVQLNKMVYKELPLPYSLDRQWFSVCVSVYKRSLDVYLDGTSLLTGDERDISAVQGLEISGGVVIGGMPHESHPPYLVEGLIKDMTVWNKPLTPQQVEEYSKRCLIPRAEDVILYWATIKNHTTPHLLLEQTYTKTCTAPVCTGSCPPELWQCGSCDCVPLRSRCDRIPGDCLDGSDERGCSLLDGQVVLVEERLTPTLAEEACLELGGSLALLSTPYMLDYATNILMYYDYDRAWSTTPLSEGPGLLTKLGKWVSASEEETARAALCQRTRTSIYRYYDTVSTYARAGELCAGIGAELATVTTLPQLQLLQKVIASHQSHYSGSVWVGGGKKNGYLNWDNGDIFSDLDQDPVYVSGDRLSVDSKGGWELRNQTEQRSFVCMVETAYNHTTSLVFDKSPDHHSNARGLSRGVSRGVDDLSVVKITDPLPGITVLDTTTCASFKSAKANGTIISYATDLYDNELLVMVTNQALVIMVHSVPFFVNTDLTDGVWHTLCFSYSTVLEQLNIFIDQQDWSIQRRIDPAGAGMFGSMILGAEQDFQEKTSLRQLDQFQFFEGDIANFNVWQALLTKDELRYLSGTSKICKTTLTRDERILLRWGDVLNFGTKTVALGSMGDNEMCRSLGVDERLKLEIDGKPLVYAQNSFKLCATSDCEGVDIKLLTQGSSTLVGSNMTMVLSSNEGSGVSCDETRCTLSDSDITVFLLQSQAKRAGETLEPSDVFYFTDTSQRVLQCDTKRCYLASDISSPDNLFSTVIEKRGWSEWEVTGECRGECGDSYTLLTRTCLAPQDLPKSLRAFYCPGQRDKRSNCQLDTCKRTDKCVPGQQKDKFRGVFKWEKTEHEQYSAEILCPAGNYHRREYPLIITMRCTSEGYDLKELAENIKQCAFMSESAQQLYSLLEEDVTASNVLQITTDMKNIMNKAEDLSAIHLVMIANITERALGTGNVTLSVQDNIIDTVDTVTTKVKLEQLWAAETQDQIIRSLLEMIDRSADVVNLRDKPGSATIRENIALFVDKVDLSESLHITLKIADVNNLYTTELTIQGADKGELQDHPGIGIYLPASIRSSASKNIDRVWFSVFKTDRLFLSNETSEPGMVLACNDTCQVSTTIVGIGIGKNYGNLKNLPEDVRIQFTPPVGQMFNPTASCVYWNVSSNWWSNRGVVTEVDFVNNRVLCSANHLTNFAVLMNVGNVEIYGVHITALQTITLVGGSVSIVCLLLTVIGLAKFKALRKTPTNQIHISLSFTLMMGLIFLLIGLDRTENLAVCTVFAVLIHYFYLSALSWMMVEGVNLYIAFVKVFTGGQTYFYRKCAAFAFGFPAVMVLTTVVVNFTTPYQTYVSEQFCWLTYIPSLLAFVGPVIAMLLANIIIFAFVIKQIFWRKQASTRGKMDGFKQLRAVLCLMALMGLGWIVGAFTIDGPSGLVFQYVFTIANISQGILIFYFHCASKPDVRNAWLNSFSSSSWLKPHNSTTSKIHSCPPKKEHISEPLKPEDGAVYNPICNIMGISVPLKRKSLADSPDSGYGFNPLSQLEDRFIFDLKGSHGGTPSNHSVSHGGHLRDRGNLGTVLPAATNPTYSTNLTKTSCTTGSRFRKGSPLRSPGADQMREAEKQDDSPLFPPSITPPPPPSSSGHSESKDSFDLVSTPPCSPPLMTFSEPEHDPALNFIKPPCDVIKPPCDVIKPPCDVITPPSDDEVMIDKEAVEEETDHSTDSSGGGRELHGFSDSDSEGESREDYTTPDIELYSEEDGRDRHIPSGKSKDKEHRPVSWDPKEGRKVRKKDVEIQRVQSFGTVKENFEGNELLNPDKYKKRRQSLKSPCLPMKSLRGRFEQQNKTNPGFAEDEEEEEEEDAH